MTNQPAPFRIAMFATEDEPELTDWADEADFRDSQASDQ